VGHPAQAQPGAEGRGGGRHMRPANIRQSHQRARGRIGISRWERPDVPADTRMTLTLEVTQFIILPYSLNSRLMERLSSR